MTTANGQQEDANGHAAENPATAMQTADHVRSQSAGKQIPQAVTQPAPLKQKVAVRDLKFYYGDSLALKGISVPLYARKATAFIGPSGCGKSTFLRVLNRKYDLYPNQRAEGEVILDGV
ncbi:MAG: ATP-binding cassette domain-containing protein, partial [Methylocella sp.]